MRRALTMSDKLKAFVVARESHEDNGNGLEVFRETLISTAKKNNPGKAEAIAKLEAATLDTQAGTDYWKGLVQNVRTYLSQNTRRLNDKAVCVYSRDEKVTVQVDGKDVQTEVKKFYLDKNFKTPLPEEAEEVEIPTLWTRKTRAAADKGAEIAEALDKLFI